MKKYTSPYKLLKSASPVKSSPSKAQVITQRKSSPMKAAEKAPDSPTKQISSYTASLSKISFRNTELEAATAKIQAEFARIAGERGTMQFRSMAPNY